MAEVIQCTRDVGALKDKGGSRLEIQKPCLPSSQKPELRFSVDTLFFLQ